MGPQSGVFCLSMAVLLGRPIHALVLFANSIGQGGTVLIPIYAMNTDKDVWGDDALLFKSVSRFVQWHPNSG